MMRPNDKAENEQWKTRSVGVKDSRQACLMRPAERKNNEQWMTRRAAKRNWR